MEQHFNSTRKQAIKIMLLGSGELGKEVVIEAQRLGINVIAVDRYANAPAMQVADECEVIDMTDGKSLKAVITKHSPDMVVPEIEAIATDVLVELEANGLHVVPTAGAAKLTMDREGIRRLAAEELEINTSPYEFVDDYEAFCKAVEQVGLPCVVKPVMSSSGKGQSTIKVAEDIQTAWDYSQSGGRTGAGRVIVEGFVKFDYEITLLTIRHKDGTSYCEPIGHRQEGGDYHESWQPQAMTDVSLAKAKEIAKKITTALGGFGLFGVELFVRGDEVIFSEVSPRPHDTGMVTMISQDLSQFALHVRAILGLPIPAIQQNGTSASHVILGNGTGINPTFSGVAEALTQKGTQIRLFGKPEINGQRRLGVCLATANSLNGARKKATTMAETIKVHIHAEMSDD
ncbi:formate-dependent phosphoribosylglycinamide formyltransferase [Marinicella sp. S1101]|uniref:formate-dependent phosphoribosylglycinamide formyltransferase n=1 Tax=Marinicella marina TaxID=2996016 RepID=UPI002260A832|nr:formate-dependent phosphoribosylglycinamide formyltransferase [Marinicella marina]MCX7554173.1 formate-dependent phosphoribosylglycinamide formyltransferase [Marinicella marina]MDJ1141134.1 formate-dependent phosphoribosylglycinamide formyltransferase [Marinicella marina]